MSDWSDYPTGEGRAADALAGRLRVLHDVESVALGNRRSVLALLPASYRDSTARYPVVYMQDGQNLFDPSTSHSGAWRVGRALDSVRASGIEAIIVGVWHSGPSRIDEYSPFRDERIGGGNARAYVTFLADTVKPRVDREFRTRPERAATGVAGSSMGGLVSFYALFQRSDTFGFAGALSPALWFGRRAVFPWLEHQQPVDSRIYIDAGTAEGPLLLADVTRLRDRLIGMGFRPDRDLRCTIEPGGSHDERSWGRRLPGALRFMLDPWRAVPRASPSV